MPSRNWFQSSDSWLLCSEHFTGLLTTHYFVGSENRGIYLWLKGKKGHTGYIWAPNTGYWVNCQEMGDVIWIYHIPIFVSRSVLDLNGYSSIRSLSYPQYESQYVYMYIYIYVYMYNYIDAYSHLKQQWLSHCRHCPVTWTVNSATLRNDSEESTRGFLTYLMKLGWNEANQLERATCWFLERPVSWMVNMWMYVLFIYIYMNI